MTADGKDEAVADVQDGVAEAAGKALVAAADADDAGVERPRKSISCRVL